MNSPKEVLDSYCAAGVTKAKRSIGRTFILAIFAGMFIALAGVGATIAPVTVSSASAGKFLGACIFPAGLAMVIVAGSELFTGNNLMIISLLERKITVPELLKSWIVVYVGNFVGAVLVAFLCVKGRIFTLFDSAAATAVVNAAAGKTGMTFGAAFIKGILCNFLVCVAVWMAFAAKTVPGKILAVFFPVMLFVLCGFEHSIANMYYIPAGLFTMADSSYNVSAVSGLTWGNMFLKNLLPVTLGNIVGGSGLVGCGYWLALHEKAKTRKK
jgi:formate transporter